MQSRVKVNLAVPGKFHLLNYFRYLQDGTIDYHLFFSHKNRSFEDYSIPRSLASNFPLKEYLTQGHIKVAGYRGFERLLPRYQWLWATAVLRNWRPCDIFHFMSMGACVDLAKRAKRAGGVVVCEAVNTHPEHRLELMSSEADRWGIGARRELYEREVRQIEESEIADVILCPSSVVRNSYLSKGVSTPGRVIPYAANTDRFSMRAHDVGASKKLRVLSVGRIGLRKGQLNLLEAIRSLGDSSIELTLVGRIDDEISSIVEEYSGLFDHVVSVPHLNMPNFFQQFDVYVAPSLEEGLAVSVCEAMASGLATIATRESGAEEIMIDGATGMLIDAGSSAQIAAALAALRADDDLRGRLALEAADAAVKQVNWKVYSDQLLDFHSGLVLE